MSAFQSAAAYTGNDALAAEEEEDDHRNDDNSRTGHPQVVVYARFGSKRSQPERQCSDVAVAAAHQHRPHEAVPAGDRIQQSDCHQRRFCHRYHDLPEILPVAGSVDPGALIQAVRNTQEEIPQDVGIEDRRSKRNDK